MEKQIMEYASGNEMAAIAIKQIGYDLMGYYPITPSTQIAESLDIMRANGETDLVMIPAEGEHSAAGICYGASVAGGRVINATSANGLLYALEQFPVQSGTRYPMVMNVVCRTVSGPLSIKGDHSDLMYLLNTGWCILFANTVQQVYDFNIIALKLAEAVRLPVVVAYDGFFTSHQKGRCYRFEDDKIVKDFIGEKKEEYPFLDLEHPITVGSYMNEPDIINNRYQLHLAMEEADKLLPKLFASYGELSGRSYGKVEGVGCQDAENVLVPNFTTSGYGMTRDIAKLCKRYCGAVAVSWYRSEYTLSAIQKLLTEGVKTNIHYVLGKNSIDEAISRLKSDDFPEGINAVVFLLHKPAGQGTIENVLDGYDTRVAEFFAEIDRKHSFKIGMDSCMVPGAINYCKTILPESLDTCEGGRFSCYIGPDMMMVPCSFDRKQQYGVSLRQMSVKEAWNSEQFEGFREKMRGTCLNCNKRTLCMGGCPLMPEIVLCVSEDRNKLYED